jgi:hypothetical protein
MDAEPPETFTAFAAGRRIAQGPAGAVAPIVQAAQDGDAGVLVFRDDDGRQTELDMGDAPQPPRRPGRPKLGVEAREVTLLPRHWAWLGRQPGGASAALRRLVETASRESQGRDRVRQGREAAYRFATAVAGDAQGYEEAMRALFDGDRTRFEACAATWPADVREHAVRLAGPGLQSPD